MPTGDLVQPPDWFNGTQKLAWNYAIAHSPLGVLKLIDKSILAIWVIAEDMHRQASQKLESGLIVRSPLKGEPIQNPYLPIVNRQALIMLKAAAELGFTPASRPRFAAAPTSPHANPFSEFGAETAPGYQH